MLVSNYATSETMVVQPVYQTMVLLNHFHVNFRKQRYELIILMIKEYFHPSRQVSKEVSYWPIMLYSVLKEAFHMLRQPNWNYPSIFPMVEELIIHELSNSKSHNNLI